MTDERAATGEPNPNDPERPGSPRPCTFDDIANELQHLRAAAGHVSYADIAARIAHGRTARGVLPAAARPARTTVYDCFRQGRSRVNPALVGEIVLALTDDPALAERWEADCVRARAAAEEARRLAASPARPEVAEPAVFEASMPPLGLAEPAPPPASSPRPGPGPLDHRLRLVLVLGSLTLNITGMVVSFLLGLPVFLDMIGTALCAFVLGPWWAAGVGVLTNLTGAVVVGPASIPFAAVQVAGALVWGYGIHRFGMGRNPGRTLVLCLVAGAVCTLVATPIVELILGGELTASSRPLIGRLFNAWGAVLPSVLGGNLVYSVLDKLIAGFVTMAIVSS